MKIFNRLHPMQILFAGTWVLSLVALYRFFRPVDASGLLFLSRRWMLILGIAVAIVLLETALLIASFTPLRDRLVGLHAAILRRLRRLRWANWVFFGLTIAVFSGGRDPARARRARDELATLVGARRVPASGVPRAPLVLVAHGSRDARWRRSVERVARSLGADHVLDYTKEDFTRTGQRYDLIYDIVGNHSTAAYKRAMNPGGVCLLVGFGFPRLSWSTLLGHLLLDPIRSRLSDKKVRFMGIAKFNAEDLGTLADLMGSGKVVPVIERRYPLDQTAEAMRYFGEGHARAKVVIVVGH